MKIYLVAEPWASLRPAGDAITIDTTSISESESSADPRTSLSGVSSSALTSIRSMLHQHRSSNNSEEGTTDNNDNATSDTTKVNMALSQTSPTGPVLDEFLKSLQKLFENDRNNADLTLVFGAKKIKVKVHSFVLTLRSSFFATACNGSFKEAETLEIHLPEDNIFLFHRLLHHSYAFDYEGTAIKINGHEESNYISELHTHASMYALADKYDFQDLKTEAMQKFRYKVETNVGRNCGRTAILNVMPLVYSSTPESDRGLRNIVAAFAANDWAWFKMVGEVKNGAFLYDVANQLEGKVSAWREFSHV